MEYTYKTVHMYNGHIVTPYPNQKVVFTEKALCDKEHPYTIINQTAMQKAIQVLAYGYKSSAPFALWCYLAKFKPDTPIYMSHHFFTDFSGFSKKSYDGAVKALMENNYLKKAENHIWIFKEDGFGFPT